MRVYLDNCCFNRPFDDQSQARIRLESEAKLKIQQRIKDGTVELAWSYILDYENQANPFEERRKTIARWKDASVIDVTETKSVLAQAAAIASHGLFAKDALHVACAIAADCEFFLTTDDWLAKKARGLSRTLVLNPTQFIIEVG
jgi:predicted nucleic acid-binding protein